MTDASFSLVMFMERAEWTERAACRGMDPNIFFPETKVRLHKRQAIREAFATCERCEVRAECLAFAMNAHEVDQGIWGGLDAAERRQLIGRSTPTGTTKAGVKVALRGLVR